MAKDFIDQVDLLLSDKKFHQYREALSEALNNEPINNFRNWYSVLKSFADNDKSLKRSLNKKIVFQVYDAN